MYISQHSVSNKISRYDEAKTQRKVNQWKKLWKWQGWWNYKTQTLKQLWNLKESMNIIRREIEDIKMTNGTSKSGKYNIWNGKFTAWD